MTKEKEEVIEAVTVVESKPTAMASTIKPSVTLAEVQEAKKERDQLIRGGLAKGRDYGTIPGTNKDTLLKPGAEQICIWFECRPSLDVLSEEHDDDKINVYEKPVYKNGRKTTATEEAKSQGLHAFRVSCKLLHRPTGQIVGEGLGSCSTMESKYISRPNDCENTVLKMAKKRAFVDAVLTTFGLSDRFTQDMEDMDLGVVEPAKPTSPIGKPAINPDAEREDRISELRSKFKATGMKAAEMTKIIKDMCGTTDSKKWTDGHISALEEFLSPKEEEDIPY